MSDLRQILGHRYDDVIQQALAAVDTPHHGYQVTRGYVNDRDVDATLAAVLPDLLADALDEGKHSEHTPACRLGDGDCTCPNPYPTIRAIDGEAES